MLALPLTEAGRARRGYNRPVSGFGGLLMKRTGLLAFAAGAFLILVSSLVSSRPVHAQGSTGCGVRAVVADEDGKPLPDVEVEILYQGEGPKRVFHQKT